MAMGGVLETIAGLNCKLVHVRVENPRLPEPGPRVDELGLPEPLREALPIPGRGHIADRAW